MKLTLEWDWTQVLDDKFLKLAFMNQFINNSGEERTMTAIGFFNLKAGQGSWFDSRGTMLPLVLKFENDELIVNWGDEDTEKGKTIYKIIDEDKIEVEDYFLKDGKYNLFGTENYIKS
jgi:hypothetical protein